MKMRLVKGGETIFEEGDLGEEMYVLMEGRVEMYRKFTDTGEPVLVGETSQQSETSWFGALALYHRQGRRATARATEPTKVTMTPCSV